MTSTYHELTDQWRDAIGYLPDMTQYERIQVLTAIANQITYPIRVGTGDLLGAVAWSVILGSCAPDIDSADTGTWLMTHRALPAAPATLPHGWERLHFAPLLVLRNEAADRGQWDLVDDIDDELAKRNDAYLAGSEDRW